MSCCCIFCNPPKMHGLRNAKVCDDGLLQWNMCHKLPGRRSCWSGIHIAYMYSYTGQKCGEAKTREISRVLESYRKPRICLKKTTKTESKTSKSLTRYMLELLRCLVSVQAAGRNSSNICWYSILGMAAWRNHNEGVHTTNSWVQKMWL